MGQEVQDVSANEQMEASLPESETKRQRNGTQLPLDLGGGNGCGDEAVEAEGPLPADVSVETEGPEQVEQPNEEAASDSCATAEQLVELLRQQEGRCKLSGQVLTLDNVHVDHVQPVAEGGTDAIGNLQLIEERVNTMKGTMSNGEFIAICRMVARWNG